MKLVPEGQNAVTSDARLRCSCMGDNQTNVLRITKLLVAAVAWTVALGAAIAQTGGGPESLAVWAVLAAAVAATASAALVVDAVAAWSVNRIVQKVAEERDITIKLAVKEMRANSEAVANRVVERLISKQDRTLERVAAEIAGAMHDEAEGPTRIR